MPRVFISYLRENSEDVQRLTSTLKAHGIETWWDQEQLKPGSRWADAIREAISQGDFFIACFSEYYNRSKSYMNEELTIAIEKLRQRPTNRAWVIPVLLSNCEIPDRSIGAGETLRSIQEIALYKNWDDGIQRLISMIQPSSAALGSTRLHVAELKAALERLVVGTDTEDDRHNLHHALMSGNMAFATAQSDEDTGRYRQRVVITSDDENYVSFEVNVPTSDALLNRLFPPKPGTVLPPPALIFVGREKGLQDLKERLGVTKTATNKSRLISIYGWAGVGKTTLVTALAHDPDITTVFPDGILWTALGQHPTLLSIMATWGRALGTDALLRAPTLQEATAQLANLLRNKRMLLIVDDVWEPEHTIPFQQSCGDKCALIFTTRSAGVARNLTHQEAALYNLPLLTEENALKLLSLLAPTVVAQHPYECFELVRDLECLPLALHVAGHLLNREAHYGFGLTNLLAELREGTRLLSVQAPADLIDSETQITPTITSLLQKSIENLDEQTQDCFAYLGAFAPKPATFDLAALQAVWLVPDPKPIVRKLVDRGLLEPIGPERFQMHALLVVYARSLLRE